MSYNPKAAAINLAAQLIVYHGHTVEEIAEITGVLEYREELEVEIVALRNKFANASTQYHPKFSPEEYKVRKMQGYAT